MANVERGNAIYTALVEELGRHNITDYHVEQGKGHPKLVFDFEGRTIKYTYSASPSDNARSALNAVSDLRKYIGQPDTVTRIIKVSKYMTNGLYCQIRIAFSRDAVKQMFGTDEIKNNTRVNINQGTGRSFTVVPSSMGHYKLVSVSTVGRNPTSMIAQVVIPAQEYGVIAGRHKSETVDPRWLAEGRATFDLPLSFYSKPVHQEAANDTTDDDEEPHQPDPAAEVIQAARSAEKQDEDAVVDYSDPKAAVAMINELLQNNPELRVKCSDDGRAIRMVKVVMMEQEI